MYNLNKLCINHTTIKTIFVDLHLSILSKNPYNVNEFMGFKPLFSTNINNIRMAQFVHIVYKSPLNTY